MCRLRSSRKRVYENDASHTSKIEYQGEDSVETMSELGAILREKIELLLKKLEACEVAYTKHFYLLHHYFVIYEAEPDVEIDAELQARIDHHLKRSKWKRRKSKSCM